MIIGMLLLVALASGAGGAIIGYHAGLRRANEAIWKAYSQPTDLRVKHTKHIVPREIRRQAK